MAKLFKEIVLSTETIALAIQSPLSRKEVSKPHEQEQEPLLIYSESQCESIKKAAYEKGFAQAKEEACNFIAQEIIQLKNSLEQMLNTLPKAIATHRLTLHAEIADIVLAIAQQFFVQQELNAKALELPINQLLLQLNDQQTIELYLHPQDIELLKKAKLTLDTTHLTQLKIKSDENLSLGGFVIKTNHGVFEASIEKQIDKLKAFLLQIRQRGQHAALV